jgi:cysteinyl-tRNA synthetase
MTADYMTNLDAMGIDTIDHFPRATQNMDEIIKLTARLIKQGFAYEADGDVYFEVGKDADYGKLSHRDVTSMQGEGGETVDRKRSPADFALWKSAKPGEPAWDSPWGKGRPGWHIECSAMSRTILGETFDIHGGGLDLVFPHHENEIAQSECCHGKPLAKYWMHNGLMQSSSEVGKVGGRNTRSAAEGDQQAQEAGKIGKSKGASAFRDLLKLHAPETIRFFLLSTHYRRPIDFSDERIREVGTGLDQFYRFFQRYERVTGESFYAISAPTRREAGDFKPHDSAVLIQIADHRRHFLEAMDDDFNTGGGVGDLFELVRTLNKFVDENKLEAQKPSAEQLAILKQGAATLRELAGTLGLFIKPPAKESSANDALTPKLIELVTELGAGARLGASPTVDAVMQLVIELRADARKKKDFATADKIRHALTALKIVLEDRPGGTEWRAN